MWIALLRWVVAGGLASIVTLALFATMTRLIDGRWILERLVRVFPLTTTELTQEDDCSGGLPLGGAIDVQGVVGFYDGAGFRPLPDAKIDGRNALGNDSPVEVNAGGVFRFVTAFPTGEPTSCDHPPPEDQRLRIRAAGCTERTVPVTAAWVAHRVLLECEGRSRPGPS